jgi:hypothetical protein
VELSEEDGEDLDGLTVIHVDPGFIAVYDQAESSGEAIRIGALKEYELGEINE